MLGRRWVLAHPGEPPTHLPQFQPQCPPLLGAHWSILSKHLHTPLHIILWHAAELSRCPRGGKGSSDVSTARHRRCSNTPQRVQIRTDKLNAKSRHTTVQGWKWQPASWTSRPPALSIDNPPKEALTLLSQKTLVHTLTNASPAHHAVLPLSLSQQHQLHSVLIQNRLHGRKQHGRELYTWQNFYLCILMRTSGIEWMCLVERESTSLPKCSTSPTCHLDGSLENKGNYLLVTWVQTQLKSSSEKSTGPRYCRQYTRANSIFSLFF